MTLRPPSYVMSANRLTRLIKKTNRNAVRLAFTAEGNVRESSGYLTVIMPFMFGWYVHISAYVPAFLKV